MRLGLFMMPLHPPTRPLHETLEEDTEKALLADRLGFDDLWVGEHFSARSEPILLLGSGTGLAPLKSMLKHLVETGSERPVVLYHGVATNAHLYEHEWLQSIAADHDWFSYRPALSRDNWQGRTDRIPELLAQDYPRAAGHVAYICGSPAMVADTVKTLMKARLFPRDIYREDFFDSADRASGATLVRGPLIRR